ncbi:hypothetical protein GQ53DRAFT_775587 [Thozetella sp. PMI_491]|nr:hypothetical protein GQ53DRAFT_775587 [Thozetella sp. PMI_491]
MDKGALHSREESQGPGTGGGRDRGWFDLGGYPGSEGFTSVIFLNATRLLWISATTSPREWGSGARHTGLVLGSESAEGIWRQASSAALLNSSGERVQEKTVRDVPGDDPKNTERIGEVSALVRTTKVAATGDNGNDRENKTAKTRRYVPKTAEPRDTMSVEDGPKREGGRRASYGLPEA